MPFENIPEDIRRETENGLAERALERDCKLSRDIGAIRDQQAAGMLSQNQANEAVSGLKTRRLYQDFDDQVHAWVPLFQQHCPEKIWQLKDTLFAHTPQDAEISPAHLQQFLNSRDEFFDRLLDSRMSTYERFFNRD
jgi:hypothetical protein